MASLHTSHKQHRLAPARMCAHPLDRSWKMSDADCIRAAVQSRCLAQGYGAQPFANFAIPPGQPERIELASRPIAEFVGKPSVGRRSHSIIGQLRPAPGGMSTRCAFLAHSERQSARCKSKPAAAAAARSCRMRRVVAVVATADRG